MDGSRLKLLTYQHSQNPQVIMPDSDSTPALLDVLRRLSPVPVVHNSEQAAPEKPRIWVVGLNGWLLAPPHCSSWHS